MNNTCNSRQGNICRNSSGERRDELGNICQNGAGERGDGDKFADIDSGDILDILQSDISDYSLDLLKSMSQPRTITSIRGMDLYPVDETLTPSCQTRTCVTDTSTTQAGTISSFRGYFSSHGSFQTQPVFPSNARLASGTTFKEEIPTPQNSFKEIVLGDGFEPNNLQ